jgi:putative methionine-R-sulfoxide reductase with GAF domain
MQDSKLLKKLKSILAQNLDRTGKATRITKAIRDEGAYRWVGIYDVDIPRGLVSNIAWCGPSAPAYLTFPITKGLTSRAINERKTVNVADVASDASYLTALDSTRAEIIVPVVDNTGDRVIGTIDVESETFGAFDAPAQALLEECADVLKDFWTSGN